MSIRADQPQPEAATKLEATKSVTEAQEIKFRGKRLDNSEWVHGYAVFGKDNKLAWIITEGYEATYGPNPDQNIFRVDPATVGQYTGLKDSEGIEIYKGDIVDFTYWWFDGNEAESHLIGEVIYIPEAMSYGLKGVKNADWIKHIGGEEGSSDTAPFATWTFAEDDFHVIGNSIDNPELTQK